MLIHRVVMINIELHHRDNVFEFGNERRQHPQLVHSPQRAFGVAVFQQQVDKNTHRFGVIAHAVVDQMQIGGDKTHHIGVQQVL